MMKEKDYWLQAKKMAEDMVRKHGFSDDVEAAKERVQRAVEARKGGEAALMTDEQTFVEMCKRFGVVLTPSENKQPDGLDGIASAWSIEAHKGPKQIGYYEFISDWYFRHCVANAPAFSW